MHRSHIVPHGIVGPAMLKILGDEFLEGRPVDAPPRHPLHQIRTPDEPCHAAVAHDGISCSRNDHRVHGEAVWNLGPAYTATTTRRELQLFHSLPLRHLDPNGSIMPIIQSSYSSLPISSTVDVTSLQGPEEKRRYNRGSL